MAGAVSCSVTAQASYLDNAEAKAFMDRMVTEHKFERAALEQWFSSAEKQHKIIDAMPRPAEKTMEWKDYRKIFMTDDRIGKGKAFLQANADVFEEAEKHYGVSRYVVAAIIGVETKFGENKGKYRVIDALSTLGFDYPPRAKFFKSELEQFLLLSREQGFAPLELKGSYAGAMSYGQFIPSSYRNFAVDFDGDKKADILENATDAIGSVANYFHRHSWEDGKPVVVMADVQGTDYTKALNKDLKPSYLVSELATMGVKPRQPLANDLKAKLIEVQGETGPEYRLGLKNFYVITRYNRSHLYALAVNELATALEGP